jgi:hypothetical protein
MCHLKYRLLNNIANALGGLIGGAVVDSSFGAGAIPPPLYPSSRCSSSCRRSAAALVQSRVKLFRGRRRYDHDFNEQRRNNPDQRVHR